MLLFGLEPLNYRHLGNMLLSVGALKQMNIVAKEQCETGTLTGIKNTIRWLSIIQMSKAVQQFFKYFPKKYEKLERRKMLM